MTNTLSRYGTVIIGPAGLKTSRIRGFERLKYEWVNDAKADTNDIDRVKGRGELPKRQTGRWRNREIETGRDGDRYTGQGSAEIEKERKEKI